MIRTALALTRSAKHTTAAVIRAMCRAWSRAVAGRCSKAKATSLWQSGPSKLFKDP